MWRGLWCKADGQARDAAVGITDPVPDSREQVSRAEDAPAAEDQSGEIAAFLARVYAHQRC